MKKFLTALILLLSFGIIHTVSAYLSVRGYYRSDGTYVRPYVRSNPNGLKYDNYGWKPSQGYLNPSYNDSTRPNSWRTPTWVTDPNYWTGYNIYNGYSINNRPKGMSKREFNAITSGTYLSSTSGKN